MVKTTEFNVQTQMNYVVGNMSGFTAAYTGMDNLSALISSLMTSYTTLAGTGRAAYATLGASVAAFGFKSAEAFGEFQRGMNIVKAISNNTNAQMQILSQTANQFSTQFRMDISEINDGLVTLGRAGLTNVNNQIQVLQNGLKVAKLEGMNLAATLEDIVTTTSLLGGDVTKNDFGSDSSKVSNLLVATSLSGPLDVGDVIETLKFAGGSAAAAGANLNNEEGLKDLLGTIGAFSQKGVIGSIAGTALRAFITKPASQDKTVKDALAELGLDAYSLWEKDEENGWQMRPIAEQIGMITKAMDKQHMTNLDRIEVWGDIVGNKMGQQMLKLDENKIKEVTKQIDHQRNLDEIYQGTLTNFASQVERLNQVFQSIYRNLGSGFASSLTLIVQGAADVLDFINGIANGTLIKFIAPILGPLGLAGLAKGLRDAIQVLGALRENILLSANRDIGAQDLWITQRGVIEKRMQKGETLYANTEWDEAHVSDKDADYKKRQEQRDADYYKRQDQRDAEYKKRQAQRDIDYQKRQAQRDADYRERQNRHEEERVQHLEKLEEERVQHLEKLEHERLERQAQHDQEYLERQDQRDNDYRERQNRYEDERVQHLEKLEEERVQHLEKLERERLERQEQHDREYMERQDQRDKDYQRQQAERTVAYQDQLKKLTLMNVGANEVYINGSRVLLGGQLAEGQVVEPMSPATAEQIRANQANQQNNQASDSEANAQYKEEVERVRRKRNYMIPYLRDEDDSHMDTVFSKVGRDSIFLKPKSKDVYNENAMDLITGIEKRVRAAEGAANLLVRDKIFYQGPDKMFQAVDGQLANLEGANILTNSAASMLINILRENGLPDIIGPRVHEIFNTAFGQMIDNFMSNQYYKDIFEYNDQGIPTIIRGQEEEFAQKLTKKAMGTLENFYHPTVDLESIYESEFADIRAENADRTEQHEKIMEFLAEKGFKEDMIKGLDWGNYSVDFTDFIEAGMDMQGFNTYMAGFDSKGMNDRQIENIRRTSMYTHLGLIAQDPNMRMQLPNVIQTGLGSNLDTEFAKSVQKELNYIKELLDTFNLDSIIDTSLVEPMEIGSYKFKVDGLGQKSPGRMAKAVRAEIKYISDALKASNQLTTRTVKLAQSITRTFSQHLHGNVLGRSVQKSFDSVIQSIANTRGKLSAQMYNLAAQSAGRFKEVFEKGSLSIMLQGEFNRILSMTNTFGARFKASLQFAGRSGVIGWRTGTGIWSPGYIYTYTAGEFDGVSLLLKKFGPNFEVNGEKLGSTLVNGFKKSKGKITDELLDDWVDNGYITRAERGTLSALKGKKRILSRLYNVDKNNDEHGLLMALENGEIDKIQPRRFSQEQTTPLYKPDGEHTFAQPIVKPGKYAVIDTESNTTTTEAEHQITQYARLKAGEEEVYNFLVNSKNRISSAAEGLTGITNDMRGSEDALNEVAAYTKIAEDLLPLVTGEDPSALVAHNAPYDKSNILSNLTRMASSGAMDGKTFKGSDDKDYSIWEAIEAIDKATWIDTLAEMERYKNAVYIGKDLFWDEEEAKRSVKNSVAASAITGKPVDKNKLHDATYDVKLTRDITEGLIQTDEGGLLTRGKNAIYDRLYKEYEEKEDDWEKEIAKWHDNKIERYEEDIDYMEQDLRNSSFGYISDIENDSDDWYTKTYLGNSGHNTITGRTSGSGKHHNPNPMLEDKNASYEQDIADNIPYFSGGWKTYPTSKTRAALDKRMYEFILSDEFKAHVEGLRELPNFNLANIFKTYVPSGGVDIPKRVWAHLTPLIEDLGGTIDKPEQLSEIMKNIYMTAKQNGLSFKDLYHMSDDEIMGDFKDMYDDTINSSKDNDNLFGSKNINQREAIMEAIKIKAGLSNIILDNGLSLMEEYDSYTNGGALPSSQTLKLLSGKLSNIDSEQLGYTDNFGEFHPYVDFEDLSSEAQGFIDKTMGIEDLEEQMNEIKEKSLEDRIYEKRMEVLDDYYWDFEEAVLEEKDRIDETVGIDGLTKPMRKLDRIKEEIEYKKLKGLARFAELAPQFANPMYPTSEHIGYTDGSGKFRPRINFEDLHPVDQRFIDQLMGISDLETEQWALEEEIKEKKKEFEKQMDRDDEIRKREIKEKIKERRIKGMGILAQERFEDNSVRPESDLDDFLQSPDKELKYSRSSAYRRDVMNYVDNYSLEELVGKHNMLTYGKPEQLSVRDGQVFSTSGVDTRAKILEARLKAMEKAFYKKFTSGAVYYSKQVGGHEIGDNSYHIFEQIPYVRDMMEEYKSLAEREYKVKKTAEEIHDEMADRIGLAKKGREKERENKPLTDDERKAMETLSQMKNNAFWHGNVHEKDDFAGVRAANLWAQKHDKYDHKLAQKHDNYDNKNAVLTYLIRQAEMVAPEIMALSKNIEEAAREFGEAFTKGMKDGLEMHSPPKVLSDLIMYLDNTYKEAAVKTEELTNLLNSIKSHLNDAPEHFMFAQMFGNGFDFIGNINKFAWLKSAADANEVLNISGSYHKGDITKDEYLRQVYKTFGLETNKKLMSQQDFESQLQILGQQYLLDKDRDPNQLKSSLNALVATYENDNRIQGIRDRAVSNPEFAQNVKALNVQYKNSIITMEEYIQKVLALMGVEERKMMTEEEFTRKMIDLKNKIASGELSESELEQGVASLFNARIDDENERKAREQLQKRKDRMEKGGLTGQFWQGYYKHVGDPLKKHGGAQGIANSLLGLTMNPYVMLAEMAIGVGNQIIEMKREEEQEKIAKLSEISSNAASAFEEQKSTWENQQAEADESFGELSDNEKQDKMLKAIEDARNDNNSASAQTRALLGKQNAMIKASDNLIETKSDQFLTGFDGLQAKYTEFMEGSGMYGTEDEYGLTDRIFNQLSLLISTNPIYDQDDTKNNTRRLDALAESAVQIDTRVKNMEEFTEDYQQVMASFGIANRNMLDIYNVRGILPDNFFDSTFFDPSSNQRIGAPGQRSAEQLASLMKQEEKIIRRFENRYLRFVRSGNGTGNRIQVTLGEGSIHSLATQLGVRDIEAAQMLAVHELQRIQDVMLNQVEPELAQTAISMYQGAYSLEENKSLNDVQAAFQNTMTQGIFAIQAQVAQLVYKATMEEALADYQAATGDTDTDTIGLLLNRARDSGYKFNKEAKSYASQGWGAYMQARDVQKLVNQGYTQEEALKKLADEGKNGDWYKATYGKELDKYSYNQNGPLESLIRAYGFAPAIVPSLITGKNLADPIIEAMSSNDYESFTKYTDWMMKSYAGSVPLDDAIKTLNEAQVAEDEEGDGGNKNKDDDDSSKQRYVQLAICNKKAIPKLNVNLFKKAPSFTVLNKNFKLRDIKINTADKAKNIENSLKNAIIEVQERSDPKIIQDSEGEYDPVGATDGDNLPTGASQTK